MKIQFGALFSSAISLLISLTSVAEPFQGKVGLVYDGDSFAIQKQGEKLWTQVRMLGIDAPEKGQNFATEAREYLKAQILGKIVTIEGSIIDFHKREVVEVSVDGRDINLEMIQTGWAWHNRPFIKDQTTQQRQMFSKAEVAARTEKRGLWSDTVTPKEPWAYRWEKRKNKAKN